MGRNCSLKVQVLYTAPFSLTGVSLWSLSIHCRHGGVFECVSKRVSECAAMCVCVTVFLFHSFNEQVWYEVRISDSELDQC